MSDLLLEKEECGIELSSIAFDAHLDTKSPEEAEIWKRYILEIRYKMSNDPNVIESLPKGQPAIDNMEYVIDALKDSVKPGSEDIFKQVVKGLLIELDNLRKLPESSYAVNANGMLISPINEKTIFKPQEYTNELGQRVKPIPILHPGISSGLALKEQEKYQQKNIIKKANESGPLGHLAVQHIQNPESIKKVAIEYLASKGYEIDGSCEFDLSTTISFGKETRDELIQSPNFNFHRFNIFGMVLGNKTMEAIKPSKKFNFGEVKLHQLAKTQWYEVTVFYKNES